jgi:hypothetical protein
VAIVVNKVCAFHLLTHCNVAGVFTTEEVVVFTTEQVVAFTTTMLVLPTITTTMLRSNK